MIEARRKEEEEEEHEKLVQISAFVCRQDVPSAASLGAKFPVGQSPPREIAGVIVKAIIHGGIANVISGEVLDGSHVSGTTKAIESRYMRVLLKSTELITREISV